MELILIATNCGTAYYKDLAQGEIASWLTLSSTVRMDSSIHHLRRFALLPNKLRSCNQIIYIRSLQTTAPDFLTHCVPFLSGVATETVTHAYFLCFLPLEALDLTLF